MGMDLLAPFGGDLSLGPQPDVGTIGNLQPLEDFNFLTDRAEIIQRVVRRLLTSPGEWVPFPTYGAGLRQRIDATLSQQTVGRIRSDIISQILQEPDIVSDPLPTVEIKAIPNGVQVYVRFFTSGFQPIAFSFNPSNPNVIAQAQISGGA